MPSFKCADIGMSCNYQDKAWTRGGLMQKIAAHAKTVHNIDPVPADLKTKIEAAIR